MKSLHQPRRGFRPISSPRGYVLLYRRDIENVCPCCGQRQWIIGGSTAECAFCAAALPLAQNTDGGNARRFTVSSRAA